MNKEEQLKLIQTRIKIQEQELALQGAQADPAPTPKTDEIPLSEAGIDQGDIDQLQSVDRRELAQLQGKPSKPTFKESGGFADDIMNASEAYKEAAGEGLSRFVVNPVRDFLGYEKKLPGNFINPVESWQAGETERAISLSKRGIGSGEVDLKSRFIEGFAMDDSNKVKAVRKNLSEKFGADVKIFVDKETGDPLYLNPNDNKLYTVNPLGLDFGDMVGYVGDAIVDTFEVAGTIFGARLADKKKIGKTLKSEAWTKKQYTKSRLKSEIGYGAAAAFVGDAVKISLGKSFGINDEVAYSEIAFDASKRASISLGAGVAFESLAAALKKLRSVRGDAVIPAHILDKFSDKTDAISDKNIGTEVGNNQFVDAINDTLREAQSDQVLRPNAGQLLNDTDLLDLVESLKKTGADERRPVLAREDQNLSSLKEFFTIIGKDVTEQPPLGASQLGQDIQSITNKSLNTEVRAAEESTLLAAQKSRELTQGLQKTTPYKAGEAVREAIFEEEAIFKGVANKDYRALEKRALDLNLKPDTLDMKLKLSLIDSGETGVKKDRVSDLFEEGDLDTGTEWSLSKINQSIKDLRAKRNSYGSNKSDVQKGAITKAIDILKETKRQALVGDPDLLLKMNALDKVYADGMEIFNDGISKSIIDEKAPIATSEIFSAVLKNSDTAKNVGMAIMDRPEARLQMQKGINDLYKLKAAKNGIVSLADHNQFIRDYVDTKIITPFYSKQQLRGIKRAGAIGRIYNIEKQRSDILVKKLNETFKSKISVLDGKTLFNRVWGKEKQASIGELKEALSDHPELWGSVQAEMLSEIQKKITSGNTFSVRSFETLLDGFSGTIKEGLGEGYLKNLNMLKDALDVTARKGKAYDISQKSMLAYLLNVKLGPLNPMSRKVNAADKVRSTYARKLVAEMVLDPDKLRKLSVMKRTRNDSDTARLIYTRMGFGILSDGDENDFSSAFKEAGYSAGLMYKLQKKRTNEREKRLAIEAEKKKKDRIQFLQTRKKSLSQY